MRSVSQSFIMFGVLSVLEEATPVGQELLTAADGGDDCIGDGHGC